MFRHSGEAECGDTGHVAEGAAQGPEEEEPLPEESPAAGGVQQQPRPQPRHPRHQAQLGGGHTSAAVHQ